MPGEIELQRAITVELLLKRRITPPAVWLRPDTAFSSTSDLSAPPEKLLTNLNEWLTEDDPRNLGLRLVDGYLELKIRAPDDSWFACLIEACRHLSVDARAAYGHLDGPVSSILLKVEDPASIEPWGALWPRGAKDQNNRWIETSITSSLQPRRSAPLWRDSSPLPGSSVNGSTIVWRPGGLRPAADLLDGLQAFEPRPVASTNMESICRAIAYAMLLYWIRIYLDGLKDWDSSLVAMIGGWIARITVEGADINARGKSLEGVCWCPIHDRETAAVLVAFLIKHGAGNSLDFHYNKAARELEASPVAPVSGWGAIETHFGIPAKLAIRRAFRAGLDIATIEQMSEQYVLDLSTHVYVDREALLRGLPYEHSHDDLMRRHENDPVYIGQKRINAFRLYTASNLRTDVQKCDTFPGCEPGAIVRLSPVYGVVRSDVRQPDEYRALNTYPGLLIKPIAVVDPAIMARAVSMLDRMFSYLTQDNDAQIAWLKKWVAWIVQHPEIKQQSAPVIIGGQGIGKSLFGDNLMNALFDNLAGSTSGSQLTDNNFLITPFIGKLVTFLDEIRLEAVSAINEIKKIVRSTRISGQVKFGHQRDYYIPSRVIIASNSPNIGLLPEDAADRTLFFIMAYTADNKRMTDVEFLDWSLTLKPFYSEFVAALESVPFKQHLMRYFVETECTRAELEDLTHSSRREENIIRSTMSKAREIARAIVADARVTPWQELTAWFNSQQLRDAVKRVDGPNSRVDPTKVLQEFERAGVLESMHGGQYRFRWGYGETLRKLGEAHGLAITPNWDFRPGDFDLNDVRSRNGGPVWRGKNTGRAQSSHYDRDPDYMGPE